VAFGSFDANGAERVARVVGFGLVVAVGIEEGGGAAFVMAEEEGGVLAFDDGVAAGGMGVKVGNLAEEETEGVEEVDAGLEDKEAFVVTEERLTGEVGVIAPAIAKAGVDIAVENRPMVSASRSFLISRYQGCQRQFSWTMQRTPLCWMMSTSSRVSFQVGARGFWQMMVTPSSAAIFQSSRWVSGGVMMSTKSGFSVSSISRN
jgi:hypothetical protein